MALRRTAHVTTVLPAERKRGWEDRRRDVTLMRLWQGCRAKHLDGYGCSRFCDMYGEWRCGISLTMRQTHVAGEKLFVDFAGRTEPADRISRQRRKRGDLVGGEEIGGA